MLNRLMEFAAILALLITVPGENSKLLELKSVRGIYFVLQNSPPPQKYLIETMPGGVALLDFNNDGLLDIFFVNGGRIVSPMRTPEDFDRRDPRYWNRLYRQTRDG